jgi:hypothetical protein
MGVGAFDKSFSERLRLNRAILGNMYWKLPVDDTGYENFMPVGRGVPSSDWCGKFRGLLVCKNVDGHEGGVLKGSNCANKVVVRLQHFWCKVSSCPVCFISGWSVRGANVIYRRLEKAVGCGFGEVEHVVVSLPKSDYGLFYKVFRRKALEVLKARGISGGCIIFHGFRINGRRDMLVWSPHFHVLGFIRGGYSRCRSCERKWNCLKGCGGFDDRNYQAFLKDGYYVKVLDERKTLFGTAWYQLNHATIRLGVKRFHVVTWFGVCGYRNFKGVKHFAEVPCPVCGEGMSRGVHVGRRDIVKNVGHGGYVGSFVDDEFDESNKPNYVEK